MSGPLVLITGITGFVAVHVLDAVLASPQNYRVRGTLRSLSKSDEVLERLSPRDRARVEFVHVADTATSDLRLAVRGVDLVLHVASPFQVQINDPETDLLIPALEGTLNLLRFAKEEGKIKKIVITSSFAAVSDPIAGDIKRPGYVYTDKDWNPTTYEEAKTATGPGASVLAYYASKKVAEKAAYDFVAREKPAFEVASINPPMIYGPTLQPRVTRKSLNLSSAIMYGLISGLDEMPSDDLPLFCDVRDVALAHVRAVEKDGAMGERYLLCGGKFSWAQAAELLAEKRPELRALLPKGWQQAPSIDLDGSFASMDTSRAREKLGIAFRGWQTTLLDSVDSLLELEKLPSWNK
ncbi:hypothetical protein PaG_04530 [Moesziomyces aphidis]|uniref:NAD-dependent epimerase/dehydratase domain-containing protein n=1 Tax=Moesziomyces aphidis TaxID=84754 RepID=W3VIJ2_MOEAP|nr:hypothetical protein PaG_04530 [Moesziomyces aphidis]